jgi:polysaccharide export outer membrane protein
LVAQSQLAPAARYQIQPSDTIAISYRYTPEFDFTGVVQPDGFINAPIIGDLKIAGLTLDQARDVVLGKAAVRLRDPEISVLLKDFVKPAFTVGGEVGQPGKFDLRGHVGVSEAIAMAGGFKPTAKHTQVLLLRRYDGEHVSTQLIDIQKLSHKPNAEPEFQIVAGDFLYVPQSRFSRIERILPIASLGLLNPYIWR